MKKNMYHIIRFYQNSGEHLIWDTELIRTGLTLEEAEAHCNDPETSSRTCTNEEGIRRTKECGPWFDGYSDNPICERKHSALVLQKQFRSVIRYNDEENKLLMRNSSSD